MLGVKMWFIGTFLLTGALATVTSADEPRAERLYGDVVHAFFRGDYTRAVQSLDLATAYGSLDPRVYYFRGAAKLRQGRRDEARFDFQYGAQLEASQGRTDVGRSLQRLQGQDRLLLEEYRRQTRRLAAMAPRPEAAPETPTPRATRTAPPAPRITGKPVSEIPEPLQALPEDPADPFADQAVGLLGQGELQPAAAERAPGVTPTVTPGDASEVGQAEITGDDAVDPFAADDPFGGPTAPAESAAAQDDPFADTGSATKRGPLGAVLRALSRSATDSPVLRQGQELLDGARDALPVGPPTEGMPGPQDDDPFFEGGAEDDGVAPDDDGGQDLFGTPEPPAPTDTDDPFADDAATAPPADDPFGAAAADDLFGTGPAVQDPAEAPPAGEEPEDPFPDE